MGLQKKRYNDGYYYYGIAPIDNYVYNMVRAENVDVLYKKRLAEMECIVLPENELYVNVNVKVNKQPPLKEVGSYHS